MILRGITSPLVTARDIATRLGIDQRVVTRYITAKVLPCVRVSKWWITTEDEFEAFLHRRAVQRNGLESLKGLTAGLLTSSQVAKAVNISIPRASQLIVSEIPTVVLNDLDIWSMRLTTTLEITDWVRRSRAEGSHRKAVLNPQFIQQVCDEQMQHKNEFRLPTPVWNIMDRRLQEPRRRNILTREEAEKIVSHYGWEEQVDIVSGFDPDPLPKCQWR